MFYGRVLFRFRFNFRFDFRFVFFLDSDRVGFNSFRFPGAT